VVLAWSNSFSAPFELDDDPSIVRNLTIRHLGSGAWLFPPAHAGETVGGRPVLNLSLALNYAAHGLDVRGYHVANLAIHLGGALLLFGIVRRLAGYSDVRARLGVSSAWLAWCVAAIWAVHPLQTQAVTYIVQRAESLMSFFFLLTVYAFVRAAEGVTDPGIATSLRPALAGTRAAPANVSTRRTLAWSVLSVIACAAGMATKENMVAAPVVVWCFDRAFFSRGFSAAFRQRRGYYVALAATWVPLATLVLGTGGNRGGTSGFDVGVRWLDYWLTQVPAMARYLSLSFWPSGLVFEYGMEPAVIWGSLLLPGVVVLAVLVGCGYAMVRLPRVGAVGLAGLAILAPTAIVPGTLQSIVEHRMYLPLASVVVLVAIAACRVLGRTRGALLLAGALAMVGAFASLTAARNTVYRSELALWRDSATKRPGNPRAQNNLALALQQAGQTEEAMAHFRRAIALQPNHAFAHHNLGLLLLTRHDPKGAAEHFSAAVAADPSFVDARINWGVALVQLGRRAEAKRQFQRALQEAPDAADAAANLAGLLIDEGEIVPANRLVQVALERAPEMAEAHFLQGRLLERDSPAAAEREYRAAVQLKPGLADAQVALGTLLAGRDELAAAEACYRRALESDAALAAAHFGLGNALAAQQRIDEAMREFDATLQLAPSNLEARGNRGNCELISGRVAAAIADYEFVLRNRPGDETIARNLALARQMAARGSR
jgi:tetratricopeptide (TPR) repeat protein